MTADVFAWAKKYGVKPKRHRVHAKYRSCPQTYQRDVFTFCTLVGAHLTLGKRPILVCIYECVDDLDKLMQ